MKYPNGINKTISKALFSHSKRGMSLEEDINLSNEYYRMNNIALIYKKPTPIKAIKINYQNNSKIINEGYFEKQSTTDYNGVYKGYHLDFEAKSSNSLTSFPLSNIHAHQLKHLKLVSDHGGLSFLIIEFTKINKMFLLETDKIFDIIKDRKSIPLSYIEEHGYLIETKYQPRIDYIKAVDKIIGGSK